MPLKINIAKGMYHFLRILQNVADQWLWKEVSTTEHVNTDTSLRNPRKKMPLKMKS